jgi:hypothetical protein
MKFPGHGNESGIEELFVSARFKTTKYSSHYSYISVMESPCSESSKVSILRFHCSRDRDSWVLELYHYSYCTSHQYIHTVGFCRASETSSLRCPVVGSRRETHKYIFFRWQGITYSEIDHIMFVHSSD